MFPAILNILKESDGYVHFSDVCKTLERTLTESVPNDKNHWYDTVRESLNLAHSQGLAFRSDDGRYKFAVNLRTSEDPKLLSRIDALKQERQTQADVPQTRRTIVEPVEEIAGPSGYAYRIVPHEPLQMVPEAANRKKDRSKKVSNGGQKSRKRSRSRSVKGAKKSKK
uniref:Uncharacterized protein n=1 Tax=Culex tarsalis TaxID=7177 RepID=A0A1Q3G074_CULTA